MIFLWTIRVLTWASGVIVRFCVAHVIFPLVTLFLRFLFCSNLVVYYKVTIESYLNLLWTTSVSKNMLWTGWKRQLQNLELFNTKKTSIYHFFSSKNHLLLWAIAVMGHPAMSFLSARKKCINNEHFHLNFMHPYDIIKITWYHIPFWLKTAVQTPCIASSIRRNSKYLHVTTIFNFNKMSLIMS